MDYKLNRFNKELKCEEIGIEDLPTLKFGRLNDNFLLFNATEYLKGIGMEMDYAEFSRPMRFWIDNMAKGYGVQTSELFYMNPNGDQLYHEILTHLFLAFLTPDILVYYNDLIDDVMTNGIAFSDSLILELARTRLTPDLIKTLRNGND